MTTQQEQLIKSITPKVCCEGGNFGELHDCRKANGAHPETKAVFENGAARSQVRPRYDLIPLEAMLAIAERFTYGLKYGKDNWKRGGPAFFEDAKNHAIHHMMAYAAGDDSEETSEQNLGAALWNLAALCWWERTGKAAYEKAANDPVLGMRGTLKGPHLPPYSQEQVTGWQQANGRTDAWLTQLGHSDKLSEEVMELTKHVQCYCRSCVYARREGVAK